MELIKESRLSGVYEYSIRIIFLISMAKEDISLEKLSYLDFILFNITEFYKRADNINSERPFVSSDWPSRSPQCLEAVILLSSKGLIGVKRRYSQIYLNKTQTTDLFIGLLSNKYYFSLKEHTKKMERFYNMDEKEIVSSFRLYMKKSGEINVSY